MGTRLTGAQREVLEDIGKRQPKAGDLVARVLGKPFAKDRPRPDDTPAWLKRLEGPADVLSAFSRIPFANLAGFSDVGLEHARSYVVPSVLFEDVSLQRARGTVPAVPLVSPPWASQP